jgi:hypothetical protein
MEVPSLQSVQRTCIPGILQAEAVARCVSRPCATGDRRTGDRNPNEFCDRADSETKNQQQATTHLSVAACFRWLWLCRSARVRSTITIPGRFLEPRSISRRFARSDETDATLTATGWEVAGFRLRFPSDPHIAGTNGHRLHEFLCRVLSIPEDER